MIAVLIVISLAVTSLYAIKVFLSGNKMLGGALLCVAIAGVPIALWPETANRLAGVVGVGRGADLLIYVLFFVVIGIVTSTHLMATGFRRDITELVRAMAIETARFPPASTCRTGKESKAVQNGPQGQHLKHEILEQETP